MKFMKIVLSFGCAWLFAGVASAATPQAALLQVQQQYRQVKSLSADFTQGYKNQLTGHERQESGKLWVSAKGQIRWQYLKPVVKDFIFDGEKAYFYEPDNAQVTILDQFKQSKLATVMQLLWGQGDMQAHFLPTWCVAASCAGYGKGQEVLKLTPLKPLANVEYVLVVLQKGQPHIDKTILVDALGNETSYVFSHQKRNLKLASALFDFKIPKGVSVLHTKVAASPL